MEEEGVEEEGVRSHRERWEGCIVSAATASRCSRICSRSTSCPSDAAKGRQRLLRIILLAVERPIDRRPAMRVRSGWNSATMARVETTRLTGIGGGGSGDEAGQALEAEDEAGVEQRPAGR